MTTKNDKCNKEVKVLSLLEHIRLHTGMYVGRIGDDDGVNYDDVIYRLMKEVIDNAVDEFLMGYGKRIEISLNWDSGRCSIRDYGRGIPLKKVVDCVSDSYCRGGKSASDLPPLTVGMNGIGISVVNALSEVFFVRSVRDGEFSEATFERGQLETTNQGRLENSCESNGTYVSFIPDSTIFKNYKFREDHIMHRLKLYAYLNSELTIVFNGVRICSTNGLKDFIIEKMQFENTNIPFHFRSPELEFVFTHKSESTDEYYSFVNGHPTTEGGTHLNAFKDGLLKALIDFSGKNFEADDVEKGIIGAVAVRISIPVFDGTLKKKLTVQEIYSDLVETIKYESIALFHKFPSETEKLIKRIENCPS
jgi:DNA gyrase subunit B/topoisomerase-4 subunit B